MGNRFLLFEQAASVRISATHSVFGGNQLLLEDTSFEHGGHWLHLNVSQVQDGMLHIVTETNGYTQSFPVYKN